MFSVTVIIFVPVLEPAVDFHTILATKLELPKISSHTFFRLSYSLSSIEINIAPSSANKSFATFRRGYIIFNQLA